MCKEVHFNLRPKSWVVWYIQVWNTNEKVWLQMVCGRKSQLYPSASASRRGRVFAVFWWKLYVTRIVSRRGPSHQSTPSFPPHSFYSSPSPFTLNSPWPYAEAHSSNIFRHSAFKHWVGTSRTWKFSTNRNVCPLFAEICKRSSSEVRTFLARLICHRVQPHKLKELVMRYAVPRSNCFLTNFWTSQKWRHFLMTS